MVYAGLMLAGSIPIYYLIISALWRYEMAEHHIVLTDAARREDSFMIIGTVTLLTVLFFGLLLGGLVLLNRGISRRLWKPFYKSLDKIREFDLSRQAEVDFGTTDITEFTELNQGLDKLIAGTLAAYNQQKEFADNASHELQTPLAIVQSKLDLLLQTRSLTDEQYHLIESAHKALTRVGRINKNLLLLTRIDNSQYMEEEEIDLASMLRSSMATFAPFADEKQLVVEMDISSDITISANRALVEILLNNLLTNAIRHCPVNGNLGVRFSERRLTIANTGTRSLKPEQLFKRFSTASSDMPGTGLGLALVQQISSRYHWTVGYDYVADRHIFALDL